MARQHAPTQLEDKYARLMGALQVIDHEVEPVMGVAAIIEKQLEIERRKRKMLEQARAYVAAIRAFEPHWDPEAVRPIITKPRTRKHGEGAKAAYRVLKAADRPLTTWEIGRAIAAELGIAEPDHREKSRLAHIANGACQRSLVRGLVERHEGPPARWSIRRRAGAAASNRSA
ncbi:hypothetical protein [Brevundimonas fluminis]|uniref:hypothetical protein n=1 Tax=Brevundimonas fluminis TaxID=2487274 RepID=UPI000F657467|nr:hypothetical protein [Brevundimonas fluminis]